MTKNQPRAHDIDAGAGKALSVPATEPDWTEGTRHDQSLIETEEGATTDAAAGYPMVPSTIVETIAAITAERDEAIAERDGLVAQVSALREALVPFTRYDFRAAQRIAGLFHNGHALRALHAEDVYALLGHTADARKVLGLPGEEEQ